MGAAIMSMPKRKGNQVAIDFNLSVETEIGVFTQDWSDPFPWELTFEEYAQYMVEHIIPLPDRTPEFEAQLRKSHRAAVLIALKQDLGATEKALTEYPDIEKEQQDGSTV